MRGSMRHWFQLLAGLVMTCFVAVVTARAAENITTHHYDTLRSGWNKSETVLTPGSVVPSKFGLLASVTLDEQVDAQPLVMLNQTITGKGTHTVVYVATERNTIYAINGDSGAILLSRNLGGACDLRYLRLLRQQFRRHRHRRHAGDLARHRPHVRDHGYAGVRVPTFRLHALRLHDLTDAMPSVIIRASHKLADGSTYTFNPAVTRSRSALLLVNGNVYAGFASYCDFNVDKSRGWLLGWNAATLAPLPTDWLTNTNTASMSPNDFFLTSIWMSGSGVASDGTFLYFVTGNSDNSGTTRTARAT